MNSTELLTEAIVVQTTVESSFCGFMYRLTETFTGRNKGVMVRRLTLEDSKTGLWSHGVRTQVPTTEGWRPTVAAVGQSEILTFPSMQSAAEWITK